MAKEWFWLPDRPTIIYCLAKGCDQHPLKTLHATGWLWRQSTWFRQENVVCHAVCGTCRLKFNKDYLLLPLLIKSLEQRPQPIPLLWGQVCLPFLISNFTIYGKGELLTAVEKCIKQELLFQGAHRQEAAGERLLSTQDSQRDSTFTLALLVSILCESQRRIAIEIFVHNHNRNSLHGTTDYAISPRSDFRKTTGNYSTLGQKIKSGSERRQTRRMGVTLSRQYLRSGHYSLCPILNS